MKGAAGGSGRPLRVHRADPRGVACRSLATNRRRGVPQRWFVVRLAPGHATMGCWSGREPSTSYTAG